MFPGNARYTQLQFQPEERGGYGSCWCETGANQLLQRDGWRKTVQDEGEYTLIFANGAAAHIGPSHFLWETLQKIKDEGFVVEVFPLYLSASYIAWDGQKDFDAIRIKANNN